jgi:hypothetical protein
MSFAVLQTASRVREQGEFEQLKPNQQKASSTAANFALSPAAKIHNTSNQPADHRYK